MTDLKAAVKQLQPNELEEFLAWLDEFQESQWDKQIEKDFSSGKLNHLIQQAEKAFSEGKCKQI